MRPDNLGAVPAEKLENVGASYPQLVEKYLHRRFSDNGAAFRETIIDRIGGDRVTLSDGLSKFLETSPWTISVGSRTVIGPYKHLYITIASEELNYIYLRLDGVPAHPKIKTSIYGQQIDLDKVTPTGVMDDSILFGVITPPEKAVYRPYGVAFDNFYDQNDTTLSDRKIAVYKGNIEMVVNFLGVAAQFLVTLNSLQQPYRLLGTNSNAVAESLLTYGLGDKYDAQRVQADLSKEGWVFPGHGYLLLPGAQFIKYVPPAIGHSKKKAIRAYLNTAGKTSADDVCDRDEEIRTQGLILAREFIDPILSLYEIVETPRPSEALDDFLNSIPRPVRLNPCPVSAFPTPH